MGVVQWVELETEGIFAKSETRHMALEHYWVRKVDSLFTYVST